MALNYHPDKNDSNEAKEQFQEIHRAYVFLQEARETRETRGTRETREKTFDFDCSYKELIQNFTSFLLENEEFKNDCIDFGRKVIEKILDKLHIDVLQEIYKIVHTESSYIKEIIEEKLKRCNIYVLNPKLTNLLNSDVYKMPFLPHKKEPLYIPLWHHELNIDTIIIKIEPHLDENVRIDDMNNIHYDHYLSFEAVMDLLKQTDTDFPTVDIMIAKLEFSLPLEELRMVKYQTYVIKNAGIPKINIANIYNNSQRGDIVVHLRLY